MLPWSHGTVSNTKPCGTHQPLLSISPYFLLIIQHPKKQEENNKKITAFIDQN